MVFVSAILIIMLYASTYPFFQKQPLHVQRGILICLAFVSGLGHGLIAKAHYTNPVVAMSGHNINNLVVILGYLFAAIGFSVIYFAQKNIRVAAGIVGVLLALLPIMYFLS